MASIYANFYEPPLKEGLRRSEPVDIPTARKRTHKMPTETPLRLWPQSNMQIRSSFTSYYQAHLAVDTENKTERETECFPDVPPVKKMRRFVFIKKSEVLGYPLSKSPHRGRRRMPKCVRNDEYHIRKVQSLLEEAQFKLEKVRHYKEHFERSPGTPTPPFLGRKRAQSLTVDNTKSRPIGIPQNGDTLNDEACKLLSKNFQRTLFVKQISDPCGMVGFQPPKKNFPDISSSDEEDDQKLCGESNEEAVHRDFNLKSRQSYRSWRKYSQMAVSRCRRIQRELSNKHEEDDNDDEIEDVYEVGPPGQGTHYCSSASEDESEGIVPLVSQSDEIPDDKKDHFKFVLNDD